MSDEKITQSIRKLNLKTKTRRKPKSQAVEKEIARLKRANGYIKDEPEQIDFLLRNEARIAVLEVKLKELQELEAVDAGV
jgi:hypothetical protein